MTMWMFPEEIAADLASGDATRVERGLHGLADHLDASDTWPLALPDPGVLEAFQGCPPRQALLDLLRVWSSWDEAAPPVPPETRQDWMVDLVGACPDSGAVYAVAIELRICEDPAVIARAISRILASPTGDSVTPAPGHLALVDHLLDGSPLVRRATLDALLAHRGEPRVAAILAAIRPALTSREADRLA